ncbi:MAG: 2-phospho-L-lactate transferase [Kofleriaceae bacterium]|nr:2-phospho-L-lactate transferase [Kofleriaceae bacterium]MCB9573828.1 2-phospho-L-lactate transferase [Kofleriaceae bacterium]
MKVLALSGGVGGARLVDGLAAVVPADELTVVVNTGDDFVHWGLTICPDLDTVMYTLAGLAHPTQGWGVAGETFGALAMVERYGGPAWFRLGDRDLGTHLMRAAGLAAGRTLTAVTAELAGALGVGPRLLPMTDVARPTMLDTHDGTLSFQDWLVGRRGAPVVTRVWWPGPARPTDAVLAAIDAADLIVVGPSNPYVSIDPILGLDGVRAALARRPVVAVSPIVAGRAVKGPLAGMIESLARRAPSPAAIAAHYGDLLDGLVIELGDDAPAGLATLATATVMGDRGDRARLAAEVLAFGHDLPRRRR